MEKVTLTTIARNLNISLAVVSRVINGKGPQYRISRETQQKILEEASRVGYKVDNITQAMRKKSQLSVALILPSVSNNYFSDIASYVIREGQKQGCTVTMLDCEESETRQQEILQTLVKHNELDGIIIAPCGFNIDFLEQIDQRFAPVVLIDRYYGNSKLPYITSNNYNGAIEGTNLLISQGHKRIVCIQGDEDSVPNMKRVAGFVKAMSVSGYDAKVVGNDFSMENGYTETKLLLQNKESSPTAIFCLSNTICLGAIKAIRETSLRIPEDISVICFDDNFYLDYITPKITRVGQQSEEMGRLAMKDSSFWWG